MGFGNGIWDLEWDLGWDLGLEWDLGFGNGIWDLGMGFGTNGNWDSPKSHNMGGKYNQHLQYYQ